MVNSIKKTPLVVLLHLLLVFAAPPLPPLVTTLPVALAASALPSLATTRAATTSTNSPTDNTITSSGTSPTTNSGSSSSSTSTSTSYTFHAEIPPTSLSNPYIFSSSVPDGTMFVAIGSVLAAIFLAFFGFLGLSYLISLKRKSSNTTDLYEDYEDKNLPYDPSLFRHSFDANTVFDGEQKLKSSALSMYSLGRASTLTSNFLLQPAPFEDSTISSSSPQVSQQGRTLRNALLNNGSSIGVMDQQPVNKSHRKSKALSMYISPLEEAMNQSQYKLQPPVNSFDPFLSKIESPVNSTFSETPIPSADNTPLISDNNRMTTRLSSLDWYELYQASQQENKEKKKVRPPSQLLDELMDKSFENTTE